MHGVNFQKSNSGFELKRNLANEYDVFLSDSRIARLAIAHLGSKFFIKRKVPYTIDLEKPIARQLEKLSKSTQVNNGNAQN